MFHLLCKCCVECIDIECIDRQTRWFWEDELAACLYFFILKLAQMPQHLKFFFHLLKNKKDVSNFHIKTKYIRLIDNN